MLQSGIDYLFTQASEENELAEVSTELSVQDLRQGFAAVFRKCNTSALFNLASNSAPATDPAEPDGAPRCDHYFRQQNAVTPCLSRNRVWNRR